MTSSCSPWATALIRRGRANDVSDTIHRASGRSPCSCSGCSDGTWLRRHPGCVSGRAKSERSAHAHCQPDVRLPRSILRRKMYRAGAAGEGGERQRGGTERSCHLRLPRHFVEYRRRVESLGIAHTRAGSQARPQEYFHVVEQRIRHLVPCLSSLLRGGVQVHSGWTRSHWRQVRRKETF